jgi:hypothetical protein
MLVGCEGLTIYFTLVVAALDPGSCPAQRCFRQKAWFLPKAPPPAAAGHIHVPDEMLR